MTTDEKIKAICSKIKQERINKKWTIYKLAKESGLVPINVTLIENGKGCNLSSIVKMESALGMNLINY